MSITTVFKTLVLLAVFAFVLVWYQGSRKTDQAQTRKSVKSASQLEKERMKPMPTTFKCTAKYLLSAYEENEIDADLRFKRGIVEVNGIVDHIGKDILGNLYVTLGPDDKSGFRKIQAFFEDSMASTLGSLRKGDELTVVGRVDGLIMNVLIKDCFIVKNAYKWR